MLALTLYVYVAYFLQLSDAARLSKQNDNENPNEDNDQALRMHSNVESFFHKLSKRQATEGDRCGVPEGFKTTAWNQCERTLAPYTKYDCKKDVFPYYTPNVETEDWRPKVTTARSSCATSCLANETYSNYYNYPASASTIVIFWNKNKEKWEKVKIEVGYFCAQPTDQ